MKSILGFKAKGRSVVEGGDGYHLREEAAHYMVLFEAEMADIGPENTYSWGINIE
ncbi:MAG: hypothetical protein ACQES8_09400 [Thermodesulfobacteriota bacterium]